MPRKQLVVVEGYVLGADSDAHPEHPIYIPVEPPPETGLHPEHPIYIPVEPPGIWGPTDPRPTHPIFLPVPKPPEIGGPNDPHPEHPIYLPIDPPTEGGEVPPEIDNSLPSLSDEQKQKLVEFLVGNLPPGPSGPEYPTPV